MLKKWVYAFGNLAPSITGNAVAIYVQFFYVDVLRLTPALMGVAWTLYGIWNSINEPLAGQLSDQTRTRWGRRIPYILFGSLPMGVFFALLWLTPAAIQQEPWQMFAYLLILLWLYDAMFTLVILNWVALFPEMYPQLSDRADVSAYRQVFGVLGMVLGVALLPSVADNFGWGVMGVLFGALAAASLYLSLAGSYEIGAARDKTALPLRAALSATFRNWSFVTYMAAQIMKEFAALLIQAGIPFYAKYVLRAPAETTTYLLGAALAVALLTVFVWARIAVRIGTRNALMVSFGIFAVTIAPFLFVNDVPSTLAAAAAFGLGLGGINVLPDILLSDVIDEDEQRTGARREGMYFGMQGLLLKGGTVLQGIALSAVLSATGYDASLLANAQPVAVETGLRYAVSLLPMCAALLGIVCLTVYPLHGKRLAEVQAARRL